MRRTIDSAPTLSFTRPRYLACLAALPLLAVLVSAPSGPVASQGTVDASTKPTATLECATVSSGDILNASIVFSKPITGLLASEIEITDPSSAIVGDATVTATVGYVDRLQLGMGFTSGTSGQVSVKIPAGVVADQFGNTNTESGTLRFAVNPNASVADATVMESYRSMLEFTVTLDAVDDCKSVTVDYATSDGTATAEDDYTASSGTLTFLPGETVKIIRVPVLTDQVTDDGETVTLTLSVPEVGGVVIADGEATGTITDAPAVYLKGPNVSLSCVTDSALGDLDGTGFRVEMRASRTPRNVNLLNLTYNDITPVKAGGWGTISGSSNGGITRQFVVYLTEGSTQGWMQVPAGIFQDSAGGYNSMSNKLYLPGCASDDPPPSLRGYFRTSGFSGHDSSTPFKVEYHLTEEPAAISWTTVKDNLIVVTNGEITKVRRLTPGVNQFWEVTIEPGGFKTVSMTARTTAVCTNANAICTADGRPLARNSTLQLRPYGPSFTVPVVETTEGSGFSFHFSATLSYALSYAITVPYEIEARTATSGPPNSGHDFKGHNGVITFSAGSLTATTGSIIVYDDSEIEGRESLYFKMGEARQEFQPPGEQRIAMEPVDAIGWINDNDPTPPPATPFTAEFRNVPEMHDGASPFTFELHFSEEVPGLSYKTVARRRVREDPTGLLSVTNGTINKASRTTQGSNQGWLVTVTPTGASTVRLWLPSRACDVAGSACNSAGMPLANGIGTSVVGGGTPITLSIADATVEEGPDAKLDFVVSLSHEIGVAVTGKYIASNGTAHGNVDYELTFGSFTIAAGATQTTVSVAVLDDSHDEGSETVIMTLYDVRGLTASQIADASAVGTITNSDPMPGAWITRFGRTVGSQVVDAVTSRFESASESHVTIGGQSIGVSELFEGADTPVFEDLRQWAEGDENDRAEWRDEGRAVTSREILLGSSFHLSAGNGAEGGTAFAAWGEVATGGFEADVDDVRMDGEVTTGMIGIDAEWDQLLAGVMLSRSEGDGSYRLSAALGNDGGTVESSLTGVYPYLRLEMGEGVSAWGLAGYGTGSLTLHQDGQDPIETDLGMRMGAVGARGTVLDRPSEGGLELAVKSDAMWVQTESDRTVGLESAEGDVTRVRVILEGDRVFKLGDDETLTPTGEIGLRHDGGDAETGTGVEIGAGIRYAGGMVSVEASVRTLVAHEESGYEEWGASGAIHVSPDASGRGLSLSIAPGWGSATGGTDRLWSAGDPTALGLDNAYRPEGRLEAELGYGLGLSGSGNVLTPYVGLGLGGSESRVYRMGSRWQVARDVALDLEGARREEADGNGAEHGLMLRGKMRW